MAQITVVAGLRCPARGGSADESVREITKRLASGPMLARSYRRVGPSNLAQVTP